MRLDKDTTSKKGSFEKAYEKLKNGDVDILIGTQMIGKGLHLPNVHLVGVILADISLHFPDFRSQERTFQLLTQVAGRAGRSSDQGEVVIQTYIPDNSALLCAQNHNYEKFYINELEIRKEHIYPPFSNLIKITCIDVNNKKTFEQAKELTQKLQTIDKTNNLNNKIYMYPPLFNKLKNKYRWNILIQGENPYKLINLALNNNEIRITEVKIDIDPLSIS